jgi:hypothetical protein
MWFDIGHQDDYTQAVEAWPQAAALLTAALSGADAARTGTKP